MREERRTTALTCDAITGRSDRGGEADSGVNLRRDHRALNMRMSTKRGHGERSLGVGRAVGEKMELRENNPLVNLGATRYFLHSLTICLQINAHFF